MTLPASRRCGRTSVHGCRADLVAASSWRTLLSRRGGLCRAGGTAVHPGLYTTDVCLGRSRSRIVPVLVLGPTGARPLIGATILPLAAGSGSSPSPSRGCSRSWSGW